MSEQPPIQPLTAWQHYRRTLLMNQLFILAMLAALWHFGKLPWLTLILLFISLQVFAFAGAWWGANLARRVAAKDKKPDTELPLRRKQRK